MKTFESCKVLKSEALLPGIYELVLKTKASKASFPGQFVMVYPRSKDTILPRPISICEIDKEAETLRLVYRVAGKGTKEFSMYSAGDEVKVLGPVGNGFPLKEAEGKNVVLIGGGIGVPPILELVKEINAAKVSVLVGYRDVNNMFLKEEFEKTATTYIATDDGSYGTKGNVMTALKEQNIPCDVIYACGPMPMLRAIKEYAKTNNIKAYISLEERMACGVGACLGCVCKTTKKDEHSHVNNARVCTEGPVFEAEEVEI